MRNTTNLSSLSQWKPNRFSKATTCCFILLSLCVLTANVKAQERGFQPGASYALSDVEAINTDNGNMMLRIPLAALPPGRGGNPGFQLNLVYNSKLYATHSETLPDEVTGQLVTQTFLNPSDLGGWRYDFNSYDMELISRLNIEGQYPCACGSNFSKNAYIWKLRVIFPDGGEHEFRPLGYNDLHQDGYFNIDPNGVVSVANCIQDGGPSCNFSTFQGTTAGMTYYTTDGTFLRLFVPYSSTNNWSSNWTLSFPDGRRLVNASGVRTMYDRNNNVLGSLQDSLGRVVTMQSTGNEDRIFVTGANNQQLEWIVKWKIIYVSREYKAWQVNQERERGNSSLQVLTNEARVVDRVTLPAQAGSLTYIFGYSAPDEDPSPGFSPGWGEVTSITLPTGAQVNYTWQFDDSNSGSNPLLTIPPDWDWVLTNHPVRKDLTYFRQYDGSSTPVTETWTYAGGFLLSGGLAVRSPDGRVTSSSSFAASSNSPFANRTYKTTYADGSMTENVWAENRPQGVPQLARAVNPYIQTELTSIKNSNGDFVKTAIKDYKYDKNGNVTRVDEYDWIDFINVERDSLGRPKPLSQWQWQDYSALLKKTTSNSYFNPTPDASDTTTSSGNVYYSLSAPLLRTAIKDSEVSLGAQKFARTEFSYDNPLTTGNLIQQKSWDSSKGGYSNPLVSTNSIAVGTQYNSFGSPILITDAAGVQTRLTYGPIAGFADLYPTQTEAAYGTALKRTETRQFDFNTGLVTTVTDVDNNVSTVTSYDDLGRPILVRAAAGRAEETQTSTQYFDSERRVVMRSDLDTTGDLKLASIQHYDQLGRIRLARSLENFSAAGLADETIGIKVQTRYLVSNPCQPTNTPQCLADNQSVLGSYVLTSNPYRAATSGAAGSESTMGWTRTRADYAGRAVEVQTFASSTLPAPWAGNAATTGAVATVYDGMYTIVTDQAGKVRRSKVDGLGRLIRVDEPSDAANTLGSQESPTQATSYQYDALNNLTQVMQGTQPRNFGYSSLGRLLSASNPESGVISYEYDATGNLTKKTDPRLVPNTSTQRAITYSYDALSRVTARNYNDGTPNVSYSYDAANVAFSKGRLTAVSSSVSSYSYGEYDSLGRVKTGTQTTDGQAYTMSYAYNIGGALVSQTYPSGRVVSTNYDGAGRVAGVQHTATGNYYAGAASTDATNRLQYSVAGAVAALKLGNNLWEHTNFNSRLQVTQIGLGTSSSDSSKLKLDYTYGVLVNGVLDATKNNGNMQSQTVTLPGLVLSQNYSYDELNRLKSAQEMNGPTPVWKQTFSYDRFGNRRFDAANTTLPQIPQPDDPNTNPTISEVNNRISAAGYRYDLAGNLECDPSHPCGSTAPFPAYYEYDGENKIKTANGGASSGGATYIYDGGGQRVKKIVGGPTTVTTVFVYNVSGQLIAEYSNQQAAASGTSYLTADHLGTPRVITRADGSISGRHDYQPFGEEIPATYGGRGAVDGYPPGDSLRQQFTQKERDVETGLDYFLARYYSSAQGRFTSPDEFTGGPDELYDFANDAADNPTFYADFTNPQSLNKYQYTYNNPINLVDPDGHCPLGCPWAGPKPFWNALSDLGNKALDVVQTGLSAVGLVPGAGEGADLANAAISTARGNYGEAAVDLGGALGPVGSGVAVGNRVRKLTKAASKADDATDGASATRRGLASEKRVLNDIGETKNTQKVSSPEGNSVPDYQNKTTVGEIKDTKKVSNTRQVRIQRDAATASGRRHVIQTGRNTRVSRPVQKSGSVVKRRDDLGPQ